MRRHFAAFAAFTAVITMPYAAPRLLTMLILMALRQREACEAQKRRAKQSGSSARGGEAR